MTILNSNFGVLLFIQMGLLLSVPNSDDMEISLGYMNEQYYRLNEFELRKDDL